MAIGDLDRQLLLEGLKRSLEDGVVPHNKALGLAGEDAGRGFVVLRLPYDQRLVGNPETGVLHGGAITSLLDAAAGLAVFMALDEPTRVATLDLRIDYLGPGTPGRDVLARVDCIRLTHHVAFVRGLAYHDDPAKPIASAAGSFMIFRGTESTLVPTAPTAPAKENR
jgi:uncharacterized protein (TIGR00369 family)